jgi:hypothetical protein
MYYRWSIVYVTNLVFFPTSELLLAYTGDIINALCHIRHILVWAGALNHVIRQYLCIDRNAGVCSIYSERYEISCCQKGPQNEPWLIPHLFVPKDASDIISNLFQNVSVFAIVSKKSRGSLVQIHESCCKCKYNLTVIRLGSNETIVIEI